MQQKAFILFLIFIFTFVLTVTVIATEDPYTCDSGCCDAYAGPGCTAAGGFIDPVLTGCDCIRVTEPLHPCYQEPLCN